jgi:hypothetical protein
MHLLIAICFLLFPVFRCRARKTNVGFSLSYLSAFIFGVLPQFDSRCQFHGFSFTVGLAQEAVLYCCISRCSFVCRVQISYPCNVASFRLKLKCKLILKVEGSSRMKSKLQMQNECVYHRYRLSLYYMYIYGVYLLFFTAALLQISLI